VDKGASELTTFAVEKQPEYNSPEGTPMWDIGLLLITALFFAVAVAYTYGCDKLRRKEDVR
jgi:hypothetical protein